MNKDDSLLEELQKLLDKSCARLKKAADVPITRFTMAIPTFASDKKMVELCRQLVTDLSSIDAWNQYVFYCVKYKDSHRLDFQKLVTYIMRFIKVTGANNANKDNQKLVDIYVLLSELQRYSTQ